MELIEALARTFDYADTVVAAVGSDQLDAPTPCRDWAVRDVIGHTIGVVTNMGRGAAGEALLPDVGAVRLEADHAAQFRRATSTTLAAWTARGLDGEVDIGAGRSMPAVTGISINLLDTATHAWDIARATGQDTELAPDVATTALAAAHDVVPDAARGFRGFDPVVPVDDDASPADRLAAFLGRRP